MTLFFNNMASFAGEPSMGDFIKRGCFKAGQLLGKLLLKFEINRAFICNLLN